VLKKLVVAVFPTGVIGLTVYKAIKGYLLGNVMVVLIALIVGGSLIGVGKRTIVEFSFMLAVPTMLAASGLELIKNRSALHGNMPVLAIGFVVSFITAILAIKSFLSYIKKRDFSLFGWYRIALAIVFFLAFVR
jgi:undecaprenyl-diphosphatase